MVKRTLTGDLGRLSPQALLRLLSASTPSGVLEVETDVGALRLELARGAIAAPSDDERRYARQVLERHRGTFRFEPCELRPPDLPTIDIAELLETAEVAGDPRPWPPSAGGDGAGTPRRPEIRVLAPPSAENPLDDLLADLEQNAPDELLLCRIGVVTTDPRPWRGALEVAWRRRGWSVVLLGDARTVEVGALDLLVVHHRLSVSRVGSEEDWLELVRRASAAEPPVPVVWVGPLADSVWIYRLVEAGVRTVLPPPPSEHGDSVSRFSAALEALVERELRLGAAPSDAQLSGGVADLVEAVLRGADPDQASGVLLQLAAGHVSRGAVLLVGETAIRCRAGYGYPLARGRIVLPRGLGLLERAVRGRRTVTGIDPDSAAAVELARALGVGRLPEATAIIPLGSPVGVSGLLVVDREGRPLPDLAELVMVGERLGGILVPPSDGAAGPPSDAAVPEP